RSEVLQKVRVVVAPGAKDCASVVSHWAVISGGNPAAEMSDVSAHGLVVLPLASPAQVDVDNCMDATSIGSSPSLRSVALTLITPPSSFGLLVVSSLNQACSPR